MSPVCVCVCVCVYNLTLKMLFIHSFCFSLYLSPTFSFFLDLSVCLSFSLFLRYSSTESDINIGLTKEETTIERLSIRRIFYLNDEIKQDFFQTMTVLVLLYVCTT